LLDDDFDIEKFRNNNKSLIMENTEGGHFDERARKVNTKGVEIIKNKYQEEDKSADENYGLRT
jgi:hypothetical protein